VKPMYFDDRVDFRIRKEDLKLVTKLVRKDQDRYENESHFFRVATLKLIREERSRLKI